MSGAIALRAAALWFRGDPFEMPPEEALGHDSDAVLAIRNGRIAAFGPAAALLPELGPEVEVRSFPGATMVPGFIDCHVHFAQLGAPCTAAGQRAGPVGRPCGPAWP